MKRTNVKGSKTYGSKTTKRLTVAKGAGNEIFLKVPARLSKSLSKIAEQDASFQGNNWQRYAIRCLKDVAGI